MRRRVVVTGIGAITPIGNTVDEMWKSLQEGKSGIGPITHFDATHFPTTFAAEVKNFRLEDYVDDPRRFEHCGLNIRFAIGAARQAVDDSGILSTVDPSRFGIYLGAGEGQQDLAAS
jgi:3-oxoacyl-[acyl-carrier-protein] synthase II